MSRIQGASVVTGDDLQTLLNGSKKMIERGYVPCGAPGYGPITASVTPEGTPVPSGERKYGYYWAFVLPLTPSKIVGVNG